MKPGAQLGGERKKEYSWPHTTGSSTPIDNPSPWYAALSCAIPADAHAPTHHSAPLQMGFAPHRSGETAAFMGFAEAMEKVRREAHEGCGHRRAGRRRCPV